MSPSNVHLFPHTGSSLHTHLIISVFGLVVEPTIILLYNVQFSKDVSHLYPTHFAVFIQFSQQFTSSDSPSFEPGFTEVRLYSVVYLINCGFVIVYIISPATVLLDDLVIFLNSRYSVSQLTQSFPGQSDGHILFLLFDADNAVPFKSTKHNVLAASLHELIIFAQSIFKDCPV